MATRRRLRRLVIAPAAVCVVAGSLAMVGPSSGATAATSGTAGTKTTIHLRGQTTTFPKAGAVGHGQAANLTEDGVTRYGQSHSPRPAVKDTANGPRLANPDAATWVPGVTPVAVHSGATGVQKSWEGLGEIDNDRTAGFSLEPPDQGLCVGNGQVMEVINDTVRVYNTSGGAVTPVISLNAFYKYPEGFDPNTNQYGPFLTDPSCAYDAGTGRFYVVELTLEVDPDTGFLTLANHVDIAVSKTSNAAGGYYFYSIPTTDTGGANGPLHKDCPCIGDFPHLGLDSHGFYVTTNEYPWSDGPGVYGNNFNGAQIYAMSKTQLAQGNSLLPVVDFQNTSATTSTGGKIPGFAVWPSLVPTNHYATANGGSEFFTSSTAAEEAAPTNFTGHANRIVLWSITNTSSLDSTNPNVLLHSYVLNSETYGVPPLANQKAGPVPLRDCLMVQCRGDGDPYTPNNENGLDSSDSRMLTAWYVNGTLITALDTIMTVNGNVQSGVAWFQIKPNGSQSVLSSQGYLGVANNNVIYPSVATQIGNYGAMGVTLVGSDHFPSAAYARWTPNGAGDVFTAAEGVAPEDGFCEYISFNCAQTEQPAARPRWGDYGFAAYDGTNIWVANEYIGHKCTFTQFNNDTTCGNTRSYYGNFHTRISSVHPGVT
jgi:hypothetical protein